MIQQEGSGWRLARDNSRPNFPVIIGGEGWAIELTEGELISLRIIIDDLIFQHKKLENQLMPEETICLEMERAPWWVCLDGDKDTWSLQLVLEVNDQSFRGFEAYWPSPAAQFIASAIKKI